MLTILITGRLPFFTVLRFDNKVKLVNHKAKPKSRRNSDINRTVCAINSRLLSIRSRESFPKPYAESCGAVVREKSENDASTAVNNSVEDVDDLLSVISDGQYDIRADQQSGYSDYPMFLAHIGSQYQEAGLAASGVSAAPQQASNVDGTSYTSATKTEEVSGNRTQAWNAPLHLSSEFHIDPSTQMKANQTSKKRRRSLSSNKGIKPSSKTRRKKKSKVDHPSGLGRSFFSTLWHSLGSLWVR